MKNKTSFMPQRKLFSPDDKMSDILQSNYRLLPLLPRFGLTLGVGEKTARQLCREKGVDCTLMLTIFNLYTHPDYLPTVGQVAALPLEDLLEYLLSSHRYYRQDRIPHIRQHLEQIVAPRPDAEARVMLGFFDQYAHEVAQHLDYEENTVFPYIRTLSQGRKSPQYDISVFEKNHTDIEEKLSDLSSILIKYLTPSGDGSQENEILLDLYLLGEDIARHTLIEDKILVPLAGELEKQAQ